MLQYDKKKNILYAYKCDAARPPLIPNTSRNVALESFNEYLNGQLRDDVMNIFMPALWNCKRMICKSDSSVNPCRLKCRFR